jgi:MFS transporter, SP family, arabinose:H+ symporter
MAAFMLLSAAGVTFLIEAPKTVVVLVGLDFFIASFTIGVGGTGWAVHGEVFPAAVRAPVAAIGESVDRLANFVIIEMFPTVKASDLAWVMVGFADLAGLAIV